MDRRDQAPPPAEQSNEPAEPSTSEKPERNAMGWGGPGENYPPTRGPLQEKGFAGEDPDGPKLERNKDD